MISRYIAKYTDIIVNHLAPRYIKFPRTDDEISQKKTAFLNRYGLPGVLGIVDGTHVALSAIKHEIEHAFVNRKGFHSINVQIVCDDRMLITNINARYPGSTHDSYIFLGSQVYLFLRDLYAREPNELNFLLGTFSDLYIVFYSSLN